MERKVRQEVADTQLASIVTFIYLSRRVVDGHLDGLAGCADVDHHQDVTVIDLRGNGVKRLNERKVEDGR